MDKSVILSVAGSGKTGHIIDILDESKRYLIVTYTDNNEQNIIDRIKSKFEGKVPENITVMTYFTFLYSFCYLPLLSDKYKAKGLTFEPNQFRYYSQEERSYYINSNSQLYSNRLSLLLEKQGQIECLKKRLEKYFHYFIIDEIQDISGRDFNFIEHLAKAEINILFVGDYYQHTYSTSSDGNVNCNLFDTCTSYEKRLSKMGLSIDKKTLSKSRRCSSNICSFISNKMHIPIGAQENSNEYEIKEINDDETIRSIILNDKIPKLHYNKSKKYGKNHFTWGETKGVDDFQNVCVILNKETFKKYKEDKLFDLAPQTKNKLYVAITRAHNNVYLVEKEKFEKVWDSVLLWTR